MRRYIKVIIFLIIIFPCVTHSFSQEEKSLSDFETWSSISVEYKTGKWDFKVREQLKLKNNSTILNQYFTQLEAEYELFKNFDLAAGVRFIRNNDTEGNVQGLENLLRIQFDALYKINLSRYSVKLRLRYQNRNELGISSLAGDYPKQHIRLKSNFKYNIRNWKFDPDIYAEIFHSYQAGEENKFDRYRLGVGTDFKIWNLGELGVYYILEKQLNEFNPLKANILKIKYTYSF